MSTKVFTVTLESDNKEIGVDELYLALSSTWRGVSVQVEAAQQSLQLDTTKHCGECGRECEEICTHCYRVK